MKTLLSLLFLLCCTIAAPAQRQRTTISGRLKPVDTTREFHAAAVDTIRDSVRSYVILAGYDKPLNATKESIHVTNQSDTLTITAVTLRIVYLDRMGRQLHSREVTIEDIIKPGETQLLTFPSWDIQHAFYYINSPRPRRQATPYTIRLTPLQLLCR